MSETTVQQMSLCECVRAIAIAKNSVPAPVAQMNDTFPTRIMKWIFGSYSHFHFGRFFCSSFALFCVFSPHSSGSNIKTSSSQRTRLGYLSFLLLPKKKKQKIQQQINLPTKITTNMQPKKTRKKKKKKYLFPWTMSSHHFSFKLYRYTYICVCLYACWIFFPFLQIKSTKCLMVAHSQVTINHHPIQYNEH